MLLLFWHQIWMLAGFLYIFRYILFIFWYLNFTPENETMILFLTKMFL